MEGIDLAGVVDSDFQGIQINFALPQRICQFWWAGAGKGKTCFLTGRVWTGRTSLRSLPWHPFNSIATPMTMASWCKMLHLEELHEEAAVSPIKATNTKSEG